MGAPVGGGKEALDYQFEPLQAVSPTGEQSLELKDDLWEPLQDPHSGSEGAASWARYRSQRWLNTTVVTALVLGLVAAAGLVLWRHPTLVSTPRHVTALFTPSPRFLRLPDGTCADEWQPITNDVTCQVGAQELGLPAAALPLRRYTKRPSGCYFVPSSNTNSGTLWMNTYSSDVGEVFDSVAGWVPETLCARRGMGDTTPPPTTPVPIQQAPSQQVCQYVVGVDGQGGCPVGSVNLNETECREMPYHFGGMLHIPFIMDSPTDPAGCFFSGAHYYYNRNLAGMGRPSRKVYCKHCSSVPAATQHMGDWTQWGNDSPQTLAMARSASSRFRKMTVGKCSDISWYPIHEKAACGEAAQYLMLRDTVASNTNFPERPEGCYYFRNYRDGTETLWVDVNPWSRGKGAETSDLASGGLRQPICSRQPTAGAAVGSPNYAADRSMLGTASASSMGFRKIPEGRCMDINWQPILDPHRCGAAAKALGLSDSVPTMMSHDDHPEGCYFFVNSEDLTRTLWLNTSPLSRGNGAQAASTSPKGLRQPLCSNPAVSQ